MLTFTLAISCLTTSNLPRFMDLTFQVLCNIALYSIGPCFYHQSYPLLGIVFDCLHPFILSGVILHWSPVAYWIPTDLGSSSFSILSFCLFILFMGFSRQEYWSVFHSLLQWTTFCQTTPPWPGHLGWPHMAWLSFIELDKAVVHVIRLASCLWLWFQFVCPLTHSLSTYHLTWVSLTLDVGSPWLLQ